MLNHTVRRFTSPSRLKSTTFVVVIALFSGLLNTALAQDINQIRWKSEDQVRQTLGEPLSMTAPVGTHATYTLWKYDGYVVAFANNHAFHLFRTDSLNKMELEETRPSGGA
ncbi:hypothetical protein [Arenicella xantha]|uniref:hypothetical protein n=1 Tax=Arenicella xantha TaxID=644221 RepID=UPI001473D406|nr:hypothetical protein [Arenicella xantha]